MENRHIFAVITARASASEQKQLLDGIISQGLKMNTDIIVISNIFNASEYNDFIKHENDIYSLISSEMPEGFIITGDAFMNHSLLEKVLSYLEKHKIPVVCSGDNITCYPSADVCTVSDFEQLTDHLVDIHHFSEIDILTGPENLATSHERVRGYHHSMKKHGIQTDNNNIIFGDFWITSGENTALSYIKGERKMPQAVICANDYMAFAMCDTFVKHGIKIPDDITVVGYEYIQGRTNHYPILTTYQRNRKALGAALLNMLYERVTGKCLQNNISLDGKIIKGDTCPCGSDYSLLSSEIAENHRQQFFSSLNDTGMLEQFLTNSKNIYDLIRELNTHTYFLPDLSGLFLCLNDDWCISPENKMRSNSNDMICYSISDKFINNPKPVRFSRSELIPDQIRVAAAPNAYFCFPLFFMDKDFGFMAVRYDSSVSPDESFKSWVKIASNALEFLRMKNDMEYLMQCRNLSELHDLATGLCNCTGFINELIISVRNAGSESDIALVLLRFNSTDKITDSEYTFEKTTFLADTADIFRSFTDGPGKICGRINEKIFAAAVVGISKANEYKYRLADRIETMMYGCFLKHKISDPDFSTIKTFTEKLSVNECLRILNDPEAEFISQAPANNAYLDDPNYKKYCKLRSRSYAKPADIPPASEACREFCLSSGHFRTMYKNFFENSYHHDGIIMRVRLARYLLISSKMSVASISEKCGYSNEKYFMRQFKIITGMTPNMYRKMTV